MPKPPLRIQTTTLWDYPSQNYGKTMQGDQNYPGATPSYIIWNLLMRYTKKNDLVVDPMCGSGTTIDVARELGRKVLGYDIHPVRKDIFRADARKLPLEDGKAALVFVDPPYGDNIKYSDEKKCIGAIKVRDPMFFREMEKVICEIHRILRKGGLVALFISDYHSKKDGFEPVGFGLFNLMAGFFSPVEIISVVRHNKDLKKGNYHLAAEQGNFFLRGFNYLFIMKKEKD